MYSLQRLLPITMSTNDTMWNPWRLDLGYDVLLTILSHAEKPILTRQISFFFSESPDGSWLVHDWFMIGLCISWDSPFPRYLYLDIRNQDSVSSGHLILWRSCEVQTKKIDDSSVVRFWLKFTLPSIIMGFSWKMGVSPIWSVPFI